MTNDTTASHIPTQITEYFWKHVTPGPFDECWIWTGPINNKGYGATTLLTQVRVFAHRLSWEIHNGPIPKGMKVLHRCDTRPCCNPYHLFLGTQADNVADMDAKGRRVNSPRLGEAHHKAKLTDEQVREVRKRRESGEQQPALAKEYGVSQQTISNICLGKGWKHVYPWPSGG